MKSQFVKVHKVQEEDNVPGQIAIMNARKSMSASNGNAAGGNGGKGQHYSPLIVDQETVEYRAIGDLDTLEQRALYQGQPGRLPQYPPANGGQGAWGRGTPALPSVQTFMHGPVSPNESGLTPHALFLGNGPLSQGLQPPAPQSFAQSTLQPASFAPVSRPLPAPMQDPGAHMQMSRYPGTPAAYPQNMNGFPPAMQPPLPPGGTRGRKKRRFPIWARIAVGVLLFLTLVGGGGYTYYLVNFARPVGDITGQQAPRLKGDDNPNQTLNGDILSGPRINILLLGSDTDQKFGTTEGGSTVYLAQTDIIVSIDPATKQVVMLSIPRDFYINIPGFGMGKLDEAFAHGYSYGQGGFPGAVALSRLTIYQDFGIPINYYAWVGLDGFVKVIDTVGGVDVDVLHPITDDTYPDDVGNNTGDIYAYRRLYIAPGPQHLSGAQALNYVRSRHADLVGDFGRSARQQQVLSALKTKLTNPDIVGKLSQIAQDLDGWVKTDMQLSDVLKLMNFARTLDPSRVQRVILEPPYSTNTSLPSGESVVEPNCALIVPEIAKVLQLGNQARCDITGSSNNMMMASTKASQAPAVADMQAAANVEAPFIASAASTSAGAMSLFAGSQGDNMLGFHSLLDLLFAVVFESPQAMQI